MRRMSKALVVMMSLCFGLQGALAQPNFLRGLPEENLFQRMLMEYLQQQALKHLEARRAKIAAIRSLEDLESRRKYIRQKIWEALGPLPQKTPLNARVVGSIEGEDYRIEKVIFESRPQFYVTANLYLPKGRSGPFPAILFPLGHERGGKTNHTWQRILTAFARQGFVALAWDPVGQGERKQYFDPDLGTSKLEASTLEHTMLGWQSLLLGRSMAFYTIWDGIRALDYLLSRPEVDPERVGVTGNSGGGTHTAYLAALDDRLKVAAPSCYLTSWEILLRTIGPQDAEQNFQGFIAAGLDQSDFVLAAAPKPYLILAAIRDFFAIRGTREVYKEASLVYDRLGYRGRLELFSADDTHGYTEPRRKASIKWFARWLQNRELQDEEIVEGPVLAPEELYCTESGQLSTSLGGKTVFDLNLEEARQLKKERLQKLAGLDAKKLKSSLELELRQLSGFEEPVLGDVESYGTVANGSYIVEKLVFAVEPSIRLPALLYKPTKPADPTVGVVYVDSDGKAAQALVGGDVHAIAAAGLATLTVDLRGWGETRPREFSKGRFGVWFGDYDAAQLAIHLGKTLAGMRAQDIVAAAQVIKQRLPEISRVVVVARAQATIPALLAAFLSDQISGLALERGLVSFQKMMESPIHRLQAENVLPGILRCCDTPELLRALAPRPVYIVDAVDSVGNPLPLAEVEAEYTLEGRLQLPHVRVVWRAPEQSADLLYKDLFSNAVN